MSSERYVLLDEQLRRLSAHLKLTVPSATKDLVRVVHALLRLLEQHRVNDQGRCAVCWGKWSWWRKRRQCTVYATLIRYIATPAEANSRPLGEGGA